MGNMNTILKYIPLILAFSAITICAVIEVQNHLADNFLPHIGDGKWRAYVMSEEAFKSMPLRRQLEDGPYETYYKREKANSMLRDTVGTFGIFQHIIAPAGFLLSVCAAFVASSRRKWQYIIGAVFCLIALWRMSALAYWLSLGW